MSIMTEHATPLTLEAISFRHAEVAAARPPRKSEIPFWCCTTMIGYLLVQGSYLLHNANGLGANSLAGQIEVLLAIILWSTVPSLAYFAWKARQQKQTGGGQ